MSYTDVRSAKVIGAPSAANFASSSSTSSRSDPRFRQNTGGLNAFQRERQLAARYGDDGRGVNLPKRSEWDVLRENHRFIRDDEPPESVSWEERLARAYESKLFKEYALIDLKHYKSRRLALRWRTAPEVVDGLGEDTCGSLRCKWHQLPLPVRNGGGGQVGFDDDDDADDGYGGFVRDRYGVYDHDQDDDDDYRSKRRRKEKRKEMPKLRAFELPFVYEEAGERKEALVKVKLCPKCQAKLTWKPGPDEGSRRAGHGDAESESEEDDGRAKSSKYQSESAHQRVERHSTRHRDRSDLPSDRRGQMVGSDTRDRDRGRERDHRDEPSSGTNRQTGPASRSRSPRRRER